MRIKVDFFDEEDNHVFFYLPEEITFLFSVGNENSEVSFINKKGENLIMEDIYNNYIKGLDFYRYYNLKVFIDETEVLHRTNIYTCKYRVVSYNAGGTIELHENLGFKARPRMKNFLAEKALFCSKDCPYLKKELKNCSLYNKELIYIEDQGTFLVTKGCFVETRDFSYFDSIDDQYSKIAEKYN